MKMSVHKGLIIAVGVVVGLLGGGEVWGQITQVSGSPQTATTTSTTLTITKPSGLAVGDVMIANIVQSDDDGANGGDLSNASSTGWALIAGNQTGIAGSGGDEWWGTLLYKIATIDDVAASDFIFILDAEADDGAGGIVAFSGVDVTGGVTETGAANGPFDVDPSSSFQNVNNDNTLNANAITTATANAAVVMFGVLGDNQSISNWSTTSPGTLAELYELPFNADLDMGSGAAWAIKATSGTTGPGTASTSNNPYNGAILVALKPCSASANAGSDQEVCAGGTITLAGSIGGSASSSTWSAPSGTFSDPSSLTSTYTPSISSGTVVLTLTTNDPDGSGPCTAAVSTMTVTVNPVPTTTGVTICQGGTGELTSSTSCPSGGSATSGPNNAETGANLTGIGNTAWSNTGNITSDNDQYASVTLPNASAISNYLQGTDFSFNIPLGATINGIQVTIGRYSSNFLNNVRIRDNEVRLVKGGMVVGDNNANIGVNWPQTETSYTYGSINNLWGTTWTPSEINNTGFGVVLSVLNATGANISYTAFVDYVQITVTYTIPGILDWYTVSSGGTLIGSGSPFNPVGVTGSGLPNTNTLGTYTFYAECSTVPGCRTATDFVIEATGRWIGVTTDWNDPSNWCSGVPTATTDVLIPSAPTNQPIIGAAGGLCRNITIESGATLTISDSYTLAVAGNWTNNGGTFTPNMGTVTFNGSAEQTIGGSASTIFYDLTLNNSSSTGVVLNNPTTVSNQLTLTDGLLILGSNDLTVSGSISGGTAGSYVQTNGTGCLTQPVAAGGAKAFPVGRAAYNPALLALTAGSTTDNFCVRVEDDVYVNGTSGSTVTDKVVDRTWFITEGISGNSDATLTLFWNSGEALGTFTPEACYISHYTGGGWNAGPAGDAGAGPVFSRSRSGITSFSPFAVGSAPALPVTWLSFRAALDGDDVHLSWSTASESNNEGFDVQRSENGRDWQTIGFVQGAGTTSEVTNYEYTDPSPFTLHPSLYYRLQQRDYDGTTDYSPVRVIQLGTQNAIRVFPNPADEAVTVAFAEPLEKRGTIQLFNPNGRLVAEETLAPGTSEHTIRVAYLPAGTYVLRVVAGAQVWMMRVVVE